MMSFNFINIFGLVAAVLLLVPEVIHLSKLYSFMYTARDKLFYASWGLIYLISLLLMVLPVGVGKFGFANVARFLVYLIGDILLLLIYLTGRVLMFCRVICYRNLLAPSAAAGVFLLSGAALDHMLLVASALIMISLIIITAITQRGADEHSR